MVKRVRIEKADVRRLIGDVALLIFLLTEKMLDYFSFHRRIYDREGSDGAENQREKRESRNQQRRALMLIETDHDLAQDEDQGCIDDKR